MSPARLAFALLLLAGTAAAETAPARTPGARTTTVPRTTVTVEENATVVQPGASVQPSEAPAQPAPRRRARRPANAGGTGNNGYSSFLTGPIDLRRPPAQQ